MHLRVGMKDLESKLCRARQMERRALTRLKLAVTLLERWQGERVKLEQRIGAAEVQRIINHETAVKAITQKRDAVRATIKRLGVE